MVTSYFNIFLFFVCTFGLAICIIISTGLINPSSGRKRMNAIVSNKHIVAGVIDISHSNITPALWLVNFQTNRKECEGFINLRYSVVSRVRAGLEMFWESVQTIPVVVVLVAFGIVCYSRNGGLSRCGLPKRWTQYMLHRSHSCLRPETPAIFFYKTRGKDCPC